MTILDGPIDRMLRLHQFVTDIRNNLQNINELIIDLNRFRTYQKRMFHLQFDHQLVQEQHSLIEYVTELNDDLKH